MSFKSLTVVEKKIIKYLLQHGESNQEILNLINTNRKALINPGRISEIKKDKNQELATKDEVDYFKLIKSNYDPKTGLNYYEDERLVRAREAMILAVHLFNSTSIKFKTECFVVLANIAWTYLFHEYFCRNKGEDSIKIDEKRNKSLTQMINEYQELLPDKEPLPEGVKRNLKAIIKIRNIVEHSLLGQGEKRWYSIFQACCLNFDKYLCSFFGDNQLTLSYDLSFSLQFVKPEISQLSQLMEYNIPPQIKALDQALQKQPSEILQSTDYQFQVCYVLNKSNKSEAHYRFFNSNEEEAIKILNILNNEINTDKKYPYKFSDVLEKVNEQINKDLDRNITSRDLVKIWKHFKVRPKGSERNPEKTDKRYCYYHKSFTRYTYSQEWVNFIINQIKENNLLEVISKIKIR